jgi:hypothetical protein
MMNYSNTYLFALMFLAVSCGDSVIEEPDESLYGYGYFPVEVGYTWEYQVDSVLIFQGGDNNIISSSFIQEKVSELISENNDERKFKLERSHRNGGNEAWVLQDVWQVSIDNDKATKTEENLKFIKLVFPAVKGEKWDGNAFFDSDKEISVGANNMSVFQDWNYKIEEAGVSRTINDVIYSSALNVSHIDQESLISKRFSEEFYADGIGLVERNMEIFDTQKSDTSVPWLERAEEGFQLSQKLISFSTN